MKIEVWTWGTGGPFGRELGLSPNRRRRGHTATSIIVSDEGAEDGVGAHLLIDVGAPSVETMIDKGVCAPDLLFLTHPHFDHVSDLDRLASSRMRGLMVERGARDLKEAERLFGPLPVIGTDECLNHPEDGVKVRFGYLEGLVSWKTIPVYDAWHKVGRIDGTLLPSEYCPQDLFGPKGLYPLEFLALPVRHSKHAPGSCLFIFRFGGIGDGFSDPGTERPEIKKVVVSGDFKSMEDMVIDSPNLVDPSCLVLDTNTIKASGRYHASFEENKARIDRWSSGECEVLVLLNHISGYGDYTEGFYDHVPDDEDWRAAVDDFTPKPKVTVRIAEDGECYRI